MEVMPRLRLTFVSSKPQRQRSSIHQDFAGIGREVGRILLAALKNPAAETEKIILPVTIVPRASSQKNLSPISGHD